MKMEVASRIYNGVIPNRLKAQLNNKRLFVRDYFQSKKA